MAPRTEIERARDHELAEMKLRYQCLHLARRQEHKGILDKQNTRLMKQAGLYWEFVQTGEVPLEKLTAMENGDQ